MKLILLLSCIIAAWPNVAFSASDTLEIRSPLGHILINLKQLKKKLPILTLTVHDPVYKKEKSYDGFDLASVLKLVPQDGNTTGSTTARTIDEIAFVAQDGYTATMSIEDARLHKGLLAFQEHGRPQKWEKLAQGKAVISPAPYYVVWKDSPKAAKLPWPYQLARIELINFGKQYAQIYPRNAKTDSDAFKGFLLFKSACLKCHSVNLQGGDLGPELNVPKNITEYWNRDTLRDFIRNPGLFRAKSKMPPHENFTPEQIDALIEYLTHMRSHKVKL